MIEHMIAMPVALRLSLSVPTLGKRNVCLTTVGIEPATFDLLSPMLRFPPRSSKLFSCLVWTHSKKHRNHISLPQDTTPETRIHDWAYQCVCRISPHLASFWLLLKSCLASLTYMFSCNRCCWNTAQVNQILFATTKDIFSLTDSGNKITMKCRWPEISNLFMIYVRTALSSYSSHAERYGHTGP
jgi:hypothetical protein